MGRSHPRKKQPIDDEGFERLLSLLDPDRDRAGMKYEEARKRLTYYFQKHGCRIPDELTDKTVNRVIEKLVQGEQISNIDRYWYGVGFYILKEHWDVHDREGVDLTDLPPAREPAIDPEAEAREAESDRLRELRTECMRQCVESLPDDERSLVTRYCGNPDQRDQLATSFETKLATLRVRVHRVREKLKKCLDECMRKGGLR